MSIPSLTSLQSPSRVSHMLSFALALSSDILSLAAPATQASSVSRKFVYHLNYLCIDARLRCQRQLPRRLRMLRSLRPPRLLRLW